MEFLAGLVGWAVLAEPLVTPFALGDTEQDARTDTVVFGEAHDPVSRKDFNFRVLHQRSPLLQNNEPASYHRLGCDEIQH